MQDGTLITALAALSRLRPAAVQLEVERQTARGGGDRLKWIRLVHGWEGGRPTPVSVVRPATPTEISPVSRMTVLYWLWGFARSEGLPVALVVDASGSTSFCPELFEVETVRGTDVPEVRMELAEDGRHFDHEDPTTALALCLVQAVFQRDEHEPVT